jgi:RimJ/RimL family protein N-acetyltransferase
MGFSSELIKGLVEWCEKNNDTRSISAGVDIENVGPIKVLEKNGFSILRSNHQQGNVLFLERKFSH